MGKYYFPARSVGALTYIVTVVAREINKGTYGIVQCATCVPLRSIFIPTEVADQRFEKP